MGDLAVTTARATRVRYWVLVFTVTLAIVTYIDRVAIGIASPYIAKELNFDSVQSGWVFTTWLPEKERVRAQGLMWLSARWGGAFTPLIVSPVIVWLGWRHAFEVFGGLGVIWAILFAKWFRDNPLEHPKMNEAERELLRPSSSRASGHSKAPWGKLVTS